MRAELKTKDLKKYHKDYATKNRAKIRKNHRDWRRRAREEALKHYGGQCICCSEPLFEFLNVYPKAGTEMPETRVVLEIWLKSKKYPEGFQVMCRNCGIAMEKLGYCPHRHGAV